MSTRLGAAGPAVSVTRPVRVGGGHALSRRSVAGRLAAGTWLVGVAPLTACGMAGRSGEATPGGMPRAGEVVRLTYLNSSAETAPVFQRIVDVFNQRNPTIQAELAVAQGGPFFEKLQAMIAGGTPPDGAHLNNVILPGPPGPA